MDEATTKEKKKDEGIETSQVGSFPDGNNKNDVATETDHSDNKQENTETNNAAHGNVYQATIINDESLKARIKTTINNATVAPKKTDRPPGTDDSDEDEEALRKEEEKFTRKMDQLDKERRLKMLDPSLIRKFQKSYHDANWKSTDYNATTEIKDPGRWWDATQKLPNSMVFPWNLVVKVPESSVCGASDSSKLVVHQPSGTGTTTSHDGEKVSSAQQENNNLSEKTDFQQTLSPPFPTESYLDLRVMQNVKFCETCVIRGRELLAALEHDPPKTNHERQEVLEKVESIYRQGLGVDAHHIQLWTELAFLQANHLQQRDKAIESLETAVQIQPEQYQASHYKQLMEKARELQAQANRSYKQRKNKSLSALQDAQLELDLECSKREDEQKEEEYKMVDGEVNSEQKDKPLMERSGFIRMIDTDDDDRKKKKKKRRKCERERGKKKSKKKKSSKRRRRRRSYGSSRDDEEEEGDDGASYDDDDDLSVDSSNSDRSVSRKRRRKKRGGKYGKRWRRRRRYDSSSSDEEEDHHSNSNEGDSLATENPDNSSQKQSHKKRDQKYCKRRRDDNRGSDEEDENEHSDHDSTAKACTSRKAIDQKHFSQSPSKHPDPIDERNKNNTRTEEGDDQTSSHGKGSISSISDEDKTRRRQQRRDPPQQEEQKETRRQRRRKYQPWSRSIDEDDNRSNSIYSGTTVDSLELARKGPKRRRRH